MVCYHFVMSPNEDVALDFLVFDHNRLVSLNDFDCYGLMCEMNVIYFFFCILCDRDMKAIQIIRFK